MHGRLVAEKERLQGESEERLQIVFAELNRDVDGRDVARADALNKTLLSMLQQREVLAKLPTWPWPSGTLRGFVTAIFLPPALFLVQRVLGQLVGLAPRRPDPAVRAHRHWRQRLRYPTIKDPLEESPCSRDSS
jgi:hypothetical protein